MGISPMKNIKESVDFSSKKLDNQLLLGEIKSQIKVKNKDFKVFLIRQIFITFRSNTSRSLRSLDVKQNIIYP